MQDQQTLLLSALVFVLVAYSAFWLLQRTFGSGPNIETGDTPGIPQGHFTARVARVIDGDTVYITMNGNKVRVRLDSIDCPEDGQHWGDIAKFGLIKLIGGKTVHLENHGVDQYGRTLATIYVSQDDGTDLLNVNERMVTLGHAWVMRQYYNHLPKQRRNSLDRKEAWAKSNNVGLWKSQKPMPPWMWRASGKTRSR